MSRKKKHGEPFIYDFVSVYEHIRNTKKGHTDAPPETYQKLKDSMPEVIEDFEKKSVEQLDDLIEWHPHADTVPTSEDDVKSGKKVFGSVVKNMIYSPRLVTDNDYKSIHLHIKKRVYKQFIKLKDEQGIYNHFDCEEIAQTVFTAIYSKNGFVNYFKAKNPDQEKVTEEDCWQKFSHRIDEIIKRLYQKFLANVIEGIRDSSAIKDVFGHHDLTHVGVDGTMARDPVKDTVSEFDDEEDDEFRRRFEPEEKDEEDEI